MNARFSLPLLGLLLGALGLPPAMADVTDGLIAYWPFNGSAVDETGNGYNGAVVGATPTTDRFNEPNKAYLFDGVDDKIVIGAAPEDFTAKLQYSVSLWFLNDGGGYRTPPSPENGWNYGQKIISKATWYSDWHILVCPDGWTDFEGTPAPGCLAWWSDQDNYSGTDTKLYDYNHDYTDSQWHHVVVNKLSANVGELWVDGEFKGSSDVLTPVANAEDLVIGSTSHTDYAQIRYWSGKIDDIRIYNRVLSTEEIAELFNESPLPSDDQDDDGIVDSEDVCPESDIGATVMVNACDSQVANPTFPSGCTLTDLVVLCGDNEPRHGNHGKHGKPGKPTGCVARLTTTLERVGVLTDQQKGAIQRCTVQEPEPPLPCLPENSARCTPKKPK